MVGLCLSIPRSQEGQARPGHSDTLKYTAPLPAPLPAPASCGEKKDKDKDKDKVKVSVKGVETHQRKI